MKVEENEEDSEKRKRERKRLRVEAEEEDGRGPKVSMPSTSASSSRAVQSSEMIGKSRRSITLPEPQTRSSPRTTSCFPQKREDPISAKGFERSIVGCQARVHVWDAGGSRWDGGMFPMNRRDRIWYFGNCRAGCSLVSAVVLVRVLVVGPFDIVHLHTD